MLSNYFVSKIIVALATTGLCVSGSPETNDAVEFPPDSEIPWTNIGLVRVTHRDCDNPPGSSSAPYDLFERVIENQLKKQQGEFCHQGTFSYSALSHYIIRSKKVVISQCSLGEFTTTTTFHSTDDCSDAIQVAPQIQTYKFEETVEWGKETCVANSMPKVEGLDFRYGDNSSGEVAAYWKYLVNHSCLSDSFLEFPPNDSNAWMTQDSLYISNTCDGSFDDTKGDSAIVQMSPSKFSFNEFCRFYVREYSLGFERVKISGCSMESFHVTTTACDTSTENPCVICEGAVVEKAYHVDDLDCGMHYCAVQADTCVGTKNDKMFFHPDCDAGTPACNRAHDVESYWKFLSDNSCIGNYVDTSIFTGRSTNKESWLPGSDPGFLLLTKTSSDCRFDDNWNTDANVVSDRIVKVTVNTANPDYGFCEKLSDGKSRLIQIDCLQTAPYLVKGSFTYDLYEGSDCSDPSGFQSSITQNFAYQPSEFGPGSCFHNSEPKEKRQFFPECPEGSAYSEANPCNNADDVEGYWNFLAKYSCLKQISPSTGYPTPSPTDSTDFPTFSPTEPEEPLSSAPAFERRSRPTPPPLTPPSPTDPLENPPTSSPTPPPTTPSPSSTPSSSPTPPPTTPPPAEAAPVTIELDTTICLDRNYCQDLLTNAFTLLFTKLADEGNSELFRQNIFDEIVSEISFVTTNCKDGRLCEDRRRRLNGANSGTKSSMDITFTFSIATSLSAEEIRDKISENQQAMEDGLEQDLKDYGATVNTLEARPISNAAGGSAPGCVNSSKNFDLDVDHKSYTCHDIAKMPPREMKPACQKDIAMEKCPTICNRRRCECVNYDGRIDEGRDGRFKYCEDLKVDDDVSVVMQDNYCRGPNRLLCPKYCQEHCRRDESSTRG